MNKYLKLVGGVAIIFVVVGCTSQLVNTNELDLEQTNGKINPTISSGCDRAATAAWETDQLFELTMGCVPEGWETFFKLKKVNETLHSISNSIKDEIQTGKDVSPNINNTFKALFNVKPEDIKAVILGQDPAPQPGLATGLSFSLEEGISSSKVASVQRVLLEAQNEGYCVNLDNANLEKWTDEGVLLLNMALTIECEQTKSSCTIGSHIDLWKDFTEYLVEYIDSLNTPIVFIFWGKTAEAYKQYINNDQHKVIIGGHPSPYGSPNGKRFFCNPYFKCSNNWLQKYGKKTIDWSLASHCGASKSCYWTWDRNKRKSTCYEPCELQTCQ